VCLVILVGVLHGADRPTLTVAILGHVCGPTVLADQHDSCCSVPPRILQDEQVKDMNPCTIGKIVAIGLHQPLVLFC